MLIINNHYLLNFIKAANNLLAIVIIRTIIFDFLNILIINFVVVAVVAATTLESILFLNLFLYLSYKYLPIVTQLTQNYLIQYYLKINLINFILLFLEGSLTN